jgi:dipeptidyl aminopeptidase/acylaminoacyl peptidase
LEGESDRFFVFSDSGPQSQLVNRKFSVDFNWYLATVKSYIVVQIDGRGSGFNGDILLDESEKYLGAIGVEDQLAVLS